MPEDQEPTGPSLEPPSFFRRRKKAPPAPPTRREPPPMPPREGRPTRPAAADEDSPTTILDDVPTEPTEPTEPVPGRGPKPTAPPLFADEAPTRVDEPAAPAPAPQPAPVEPVPAPRRAHREGPPVPGRLAAALAGLLAGAMIVGLTTASFSLCESIQGTQSCGGPGVFLLLAILVLTVVVAAAVLRLLGVGEPGSTSFMAVGLTSVVALLFLVDQLFEWWMVIAIPVVSVAMFVLSHWVTTTFVEDEPEVGLADEPEVVDHDVR